MKESNVRLPLSKPAALCGSMCRPPWYRSERENGLACRDFSATGFVWVLCHRGSRLSLSLDAQESLRRPALSQSLAPEQAQHPQASTRARRPDGQSAQAVHLPHVLHCMTEPRTSQLLEQQAPQAAASLYHRCSGRRTRRVQQSFCPAATSRSPRDCGDTAPWAAAMNPTSNSCHARRP